MKPKDLKCPVTRAERRPFFHEGVLFVPPFLGLHEQWDQFPWEETGATVAVEYCSGNGDWVVEKALAHPKLHWIAVEKRFDRVRKIWSKMRNHCIHNLFIVCGEALTFTRHYLRTSSIHEMYINFPDPWPKRGHAKHRLMQPAFVEEMGRVMRENGSLVLVTDDPEYSVQMIRAMRASPLWIPSIPSPYYTHKWSDYGDSFFDTLFRAKGCTIRYHAFTRTSP